jgi:YHS domain-containing protein
MGKRMKTQTGDLEMKKYTIGSIAIVAMAAAMAWTSVAFAEGHNCCGAAPAATAPANHGAAKSAAPAKGDDAIIAEQKAGYPLDTCVVLGNKLGEHGDAVDHVYKGRLVRFCCAGCIATFEKDPQKYLGKIDAAKAKAEPKAGTKSDGTGESQGAHSEHHH